MQGTHTGKFNCTASINAIAIARTEPRARDARIGAYRRTFALGTSRNYPRDSPNCRRVKNSARLSTLGPSILALVRSLNRGFQSKEETPCVYHEDYIAFSPLREKYKFLPSKKTRVYQNANRGVSTMEGIVFPTSRCKLPVRFPKDTRVAHDRSRWR